MAKGQAERLMGLLEEVLAAQKTTWQDLSAIAVGVGPGNFTGIRIGVSAARGLALGLAALGGRRVSALLVIRAWRRQGPVTFSLESWLASGRSRRIAPWQTARFSPLRRRFGCTLERPSLGRELTVRLIAVCWRAN